MDKIRFMRLWDLYHPLLTETQQEITGMYFNLDLTVSEIAEEKGVSRQSVSDCLNVCKKELEGFEERLQRERAQTEHEKKLAAARGWADEFLKLHPEYAADIAALLDILGEGRRV